MNYKNRKSFQLFYFRIKKLISEWIIIVTNLICSEGGEMKKDEVKETLKYPNPFKAEWVKFNYLIRKYFKLISEIPGSKVIITSDKYYQFIYSQLCKNRMELGP